MKSILLVIWLVFCSGCGTFVVHRFDEMTLTQIEKTVAFELQDYSLTLQALKNVDAPESVLYSLCVRHESELSRLRAWIEYERAKKPE